MCENVSTVNTNFLSYGTLMYPKLKVYLINVLIS